MFTSAALPNSSPHSSVRVRRLAQVSANFPQSLLMAGVVPALMVASTKGRLYSSD